MQARNWVGKYLDRSKFCYMIRCNYSIRFDIIFNFNKYLVILVYVFVIDNLFSNSTKDCINFIASCIRDLTRPWIWR